MTAPAFIFGAEGLPKTPQELARMRALAAALQKNRNPRTVGEGLASLGEGIASGLIMRQANKAEKAGKEGAANAFSSAIQGMFGGGEAAAASPAPVGDAGVSYSGNIPAADMETDPVNRRIAQGFSAFGDTDAPENWASIREGIFAGESGGDYNALFGFSNRDGGKFAGTKLTDMTVDEALAFSNPSGPYGQWVKGKVGRVATPMGAYQVVGSTLQGVKKGMGLRGDEKMTPELQEKIGQYIYGTQGTGAWAGYKGPRAPSGQYASVNPSIAPEQPAIDPKTVLAQRLAKVQGQNVSANPMPEVAQAAPQQQPTGVQRVAQALPQGGMDQQTLQIIDAMNNPYMSAGQKAVLGAILQKRMQANDPLRQLQLEKGRAELNQLNNPKPDVRLVDGRLVQIGRDGTAKEIYSTGETDAPTVQKVKLPDGSELAVQWNSQSGQWDPINAPSGGADITPKNKLTESQSKLTLFQSLQTETQPVLLGLEQQFNPGNLPDFFAGNVLGGNFFKTEQGQIYDSAATAWAEGALRIATGAAATPEEMARTKKAYFAQPGDTPKTIQFKAQMRDMYDRSIQRALGSRDVEGGLPSPADFLKEQKKETEGQSGGQVNTDGALDAARAAIAKGASREAVINRLKEAGIDPNGL